MEEVMFDWRRPVGRLLFGLLSVGMMIGESPAATPTMTAVVDTVYRADECLNASVWAKAGQP
ncbi:MAG: hypothetical protein DMG71_11740 [Acidobacteria bacterium]|nr:MAG: hypothetical protein DMG71_11740 [Acidobacteriota bacterium]